MTKGTIEIKASIGRHKFTIPADSNTDKAIVRVGSPYASWAENQFFKQPVNVHHGELDTDPITISIDGVETVIAPGNEGQIQNAAGDATIIYRHDKLTAQDTKP